MVFRVRGVFLSGFQTYCKVKVILFRGYRLHVWISSLAFGVLGLRLQIACVGYGLRTRDFLA